MSEHGDERVLKPTKASRLGGDEPFAGLDASVRDFWAWGFSDLRANVVRGVLAEYLVARAVGATEPVRSVNGP